VSNDQGLDGRRARLYGVIRFWAVPFGTRSTTDRTKVRSVTSFWLCDNARSLVPRGWMELQIRPFEPPSWSCTMVSTNRPSKFGAGLNLTPDLFGRLHWHPKPCMTIKRVLLIEEGAPLAGLYDEPLTPILILTHLSPLDCRH